MALVPFYQLEGQIDVIKEIDLKNSDNLIERWYEDENGNRAVVIMPLVMLGGVARQAGSIL